MLHACHKSARVIVDLDNGPNGSSAEPRTRPVIWSATLLGVSSARTPSHAILAGRVAQPALHGLVLKGPTDDVFDASAAWLGAFASADDDWTSGWVVWGPSDPT